MLRHKWEIECFPSDDNDGEYSSVIHKISIPFEDAGTEDSAYDMIRTDPELGYVDEGCGHEHDCCGCWFLSSYDIHLLDDYDRAWNFILHRTYSRNY